LKFGKENEVDNLELSRRGEGMTRIENLVIFVRNAKEGERIKVRVMRVGRKFAEAEVVDGTEMQGVGTEKQEWLRDITCFRSYVRKVFAQSLFLKEKPVFLVP
jgi:predicted RNA-binding protein with TRAM domain